MPPSKRKISKLIVEPVLKFAEADEGQGADGAQQLSVRLVLEGASTGATKPFAASVEFEDRFILFEQEADQGFHMA